MNNAIRVVTTVSLVTLDNISKTEYTKEGTLTAQLSQTVTKDSYYPAKQVSSDLQGGLFTGKEFGFEEKKYASTETRKAWIPVPVGATEEQIKAELTSDAKKDQVIYRVISSSPVLTDQQKYSVSIGQSNMNTYADAQAMRFPDTDKTRAEGTAGKLILDSNSNVQYRKTFYWPTAKEDVDMRDATNIFCSPELKMELAGSVPQGAGILAGQTIN